MLQNTHITTVEQFLDAGMNGYNIYSKENGQIIAFLESLHPRREALPLFKTNPQDLQETFVTFFSSAIEDVFAYSYGESIREYLSAHFSSNYFLKPFDIDSIHFLIRKSFYKIKAHHIKQLFSIFPQFLYKPQESFHICKYLSIFSKEELSHLSTTENIYTLLTQHNEGHEIDSAEHFLHSIHAFLKKEIQHPSEKVVPAQHIVEQFKEKNNANFHDDSYKSDQAQHYAHTSNVHTPEPTPKAFVPKDTIQKTTSILLDDSTQHYTSSDEPVNASPYTLITQKNPVSKHVPIPIEENEPHEGELPYQDAPHTINISQRELLQCTKKEFDNALLEIEKLLEKENTRFPLLNELFTDEKRNLFAFIAYCHSYPLLTQQGQLDVLHHAYNTVKTYQKFEEHFAQETRFVVLLSLAQNSNFALEDNSSLTTDTLPILRAIDRYQHFLPNFPALLIEIYEIATIATFSTQYYHAPMENEEDVAIIFRHINIISALSLIKEIQEGKNSLLFARELAHSSIDDIQEYPEYFNAYYFQILLEDTIESILEFLPPHEKNSHILFALLYYMESTYNLSLEEDSERTKCIEYLAYILSQAKQLTEERGAVSIMPAVHQLLQQKVTP